MYFNPSIRHRAWYSGAGFIAGDGDGIVSVGGIPASREVLLYQINQYDSTLTFIKKVRSTDKGHYLFGAINKNAKYLIIARDLPPSDDVERYEPAVWDYVTPKDDKTIDEQMEMWKSWQT